MNLSLPFSPQYYLEDSHLAVCILLQDGFGSGRHGVHTPLVPPRPHIPRHTRLLPLHRLGPLHHKIAAARHLHREPNFWPEVKRADCEIKYMTAIPRCTQSSCPLIKHNTGAPKILSVYGPTRKTEAYFDICFTFSGGSSKTGRR